MSDKLSGFLYLAVCVLFYVIVFNFSDVQGATLRHSGDMNKLHQKIDAEESVFKLLADDICWDLEFYQANKTSAWHQNCRNNFIKLHENKADIPPKVRLMCQYQNNVGYSVEPLQETDAWTLVVLTPKNDTLINLPYDLIEGTNKVSHPHIVRPGHYSTWSILLSSNGTHSPWRRGPDIRPWNHTGEIRHRTYDVQLKQFPKIVDGEYGINAVFTWNSFDDEDICFHFVNHCNGEIKEMKIWDTESDDSHSREVLGLPLGASCELRLAGKYGVTRYQYRTMSCNDLDGCIDYEMAQNISVVAEPGEAGWAVYVSWEYNHEPLFYNVTLMADDVTRSVQLLGNVTETTFVDVNSTGLYFVAIGAVLKDRTVWTSSRAIFPVQREAWGARGALGGAWGALAAAAALAALALLWRRRRKATLTHIYFPEPEDKPPKEGEGEGAELESAADDSWELRSERLLLHEVVGEGAFGIVRRGTLAPAGKEVAVKMLKDFPTLDEIRSFRAEMELMKSVGAHPHIVSLVGCCSGRRPFIVAEYCSRGDLLSYLRCSWDIMVSKRNAKYYNNNLETTDYRNDLFKCKLQEEHSKLVVNKLYDLQGVCDADLTTRDLLSFCRQIAMGMEFLASNRLVHRDLAARNVLVSSDRTLKIADFGLSRDVYEENQYKQKGNGKMPMKWMALESLTRRIYTTQSDVWSFGVVMWEVASVGGSPYAGVAAARLPRLLRAGYRMPRPANCSKQLYELMCMCWRAAPRLRPTFAQLHAALDAQLAACAHDYLALELPADDAPSPRHKYVDVIRDKLGLSREEGYARRLRAAHTNHYSSPPACLRPPDLYVPS